MDERSKVISIKILNESRIITSLIKGYDLDSFVIDEKTKRAVSMTLINIGELVKNLPHDFRQANPSIPWKSIAGLRDVTAHGYDKLSMEDIWGTASVEIPKLREQLTKILQTI